MYYLFIHKKEDIDEYRCHFDKVKKNIEMGKTPVFSELRCAKTNLFESFPYNILTGALLIVGTILLNKIKINETIKIAIILVVNSLCGAIANFIFVAIKHFLRLKLCKRMGIEPSEENIAVMESLEYQSV